MQSNMMKTEDIDKKIGMPDVDEEWARFEHEVLGEEETKPQKRVFMGRAIGIAASIALLAGIFLWVNDEEKQTESNRIVAQSTNTQMPEESDVAIGNETKEETTVNMQIDAVVDNNRTDIPPSNHVAMTTPQSNDREVARPANDREVTRPANDREDTRPANDGQEAQTPAIDKRTDIKIFSVVEQQPSFRGGNRALQEFIKQNLKYPPMAQTYGVSGRVIMQFVIDSVGYVSDIKHVKDILKYDTLLLNRESEARQIQLKEQIARQLEEECARVIALMPRWSPAKMYGKAVSTKYNMPFQFQPTELLKNASDSASLGAHQ